MVLRSPRTSRRRGRPRTLALECLETRKLLSVPPPTTSGISDLYVDEDAADETIELYHSFDDIDDDHSDMTFDVVNNTNSPLFDSVDLQSDTYGGYGGLALDFAGDAYGDAQLTVRATDPGGLWVETSFTVHVAPVNDPPTILGISDLYVDEDAADETIELYDSFDDNDDDHSDMSFEVVDNTNSSLFDSLYLQSDSYGGYGSLLLDFAGDAYGDAELTVRATDYGGLWVETSFTVHVAPVNDAPVISDFGGSEGYGSFWTFSGTVSDVDDDVEGMIVNLGGVLDGYEDIYATVLADGTFSVTAEYPGLQTGGVSAQTEDDDGLDSNVAWYEIYVT